MKTQPYVYEYSESTEETCCHLTSIYDSCQKLPNEKQKLIRNMLIMMLMVDKIEIFMKFRLFRHKTNLVWNWEDFVCSSFQNGEDQDKNQY